MMTIERYHYYVYVRVVAGALEVVVGFSCEHFGLRRTLTGVLTQ